MNSTIIQCNKQWSSKVSPHTSSFNGFRCSFLLKPVNMPIIDGDDTLSTASNRSQSQRATVILSLDLVTASRWHLYFLRSISPLLPTFPTTRSIRRYVELWLPLISEFCNPRSSLSSLFLLPPPDVHWVWHCHCLAPASRYRDYCASRFGFLIERPAIFDEDNCDYAEARCREIWESRFPSEPFDLEDYDRGEEEEEEIRSGGVDEIRAAVERFRILSDEFSDPFVSETVYLVAAKKRYLDFLRLVNGSGFDSRFVPASDIMLMWLTHQSLPLKYEKDTEGLVMLDQKVVGFGEHALPEEVDATKTAWEEMFNEPYERAGAVIEPMRAPARAVFNWTPVEIDVNRRYKCLTTRVLLEVCIFFKGHWQDAERKEASKRFLRLKTVRCHREFKLEMPFAKLSSKTWRKMWHLFCEFGTRGIIIEVCQQGTTCLQNTKSCKKVIFFWNDLLRATSFTLTNEMELQVRALSSITPPVQAPYLLKYVPDRVTDDSGAMVSDEILKRSRYRPQEGRWITRTVLDHTGRECFVTRIRVGKGFWRLGAETPSAVNWEDRIIEVREGSWKYIASSVGFAPETVVGTAIPSKDTVDNRKIIWSLSTGDVLTIKWEDKLEFCLKNNASGELARLLTGRKLQYQVKDANQSEKIDEEEDHYLTLVRCSFEYPNRRATALINWKLLALEFLPDEDAVMMLLLCMAIVRTISEIRREDVSGLLVRKRLTEVRAGYRDWGSVLLPPSPNLPPHFRPWYINAEEVLGPAKIKDAREFITKHSPADGKDSLYKQAIIP